MRKILILTTALSAVGFTASAQTKEINLVSWGGAYSKSQVEAYNKPFEAKTGIKVNMIDTDDPSVPLKAQVEANNVTGDVFDVDLGAAMRMCDEGALVEMKPEDFPAGADGTPAAEDFVTNSFPGCAVASIVWGTVIAYDTTKFPNGGPTTAADFFDTAKFPGKRGLPKNPKRTLYLALVADGVPADQVYDVLDTDEGIERAFMKLDTIKNDVVWWEAGAQPIQLLADGEVVMTTAYNGRVFDAQVAEKKPFEVVWDGQLMEYEMFVIPKAAKNQEAAWEYVKFATTTESLAKQAEWIAYGPARKSSDALVGKYNDGTTDMKPYMPTNPDHMKSVVWDNPEFWADKQAELTERFNTWLAS